jgi:CHC2 zinc finger
MRLSFSPRVWLDAREVKSRADFLTLASRYVRLRRAGRQYVCCCPFHVETNASCYIEPERKIWKCFGCQRGGDLFDFVMLAEDCTFSDALRVVVDSSGIARESGPRSGPRVRASVGAAPDPAKQGTPHSQSLTSSLARILEPLEGTNRRLRKIEATNRAASAALATPCEPRADGSAFTCQKPDNSPEEKQHGYRT